MSNIPTGAELARPFVPSKDFERSKRFYLALGFEQVLDGEVAIFSVGASSFILQRYYQKEWAENFMMQLMVDDLDAWWAHLTALDLPKHFAVPCRRRGHRPCSLGGFASLTSWIRAGCCGTWRSAAPTCDTTAERRVKDRRRPPVPR